MAVTQALLTDFAHTTSLLRMSPLKVLSGTVLITKASFLLRRRVPNLWVRHFVSQQWLWPPQTLTRRGTFCLIPLTGSRSCIMPSVSSFNGLGLWLVQVSAQFATWLRNTAPRFAPSQRSWGSRSFRSLFWLPLLLRHLPLFPLILCQPQLQEDMWPAPTSHLPLGLQAPLMLSLV
jgi:hypothetical protein